MGRILGQTGRWLTAGDRVLAVGMALVVIYYIATPGPFQGKASGDGWFGFLYLKNLVAHGSIDMQLVAPEYLRFFGVSGPGHHMPNRCPIGPVSAWMPFYLLSMVPEWLGRALHWSTARWDGQSPAQAFITGFGTLFAVLVGWRAVFVLLRRHVSLAATRLGTLATMFATPLVWYTTQQPFYQHGLAFAAVACFVERWEATRGETQLRRFALLGALGGFAMSVRLQEMVWTLPLVVEVLLGLAKSDTRRRWLVGAGMGIFCAVLAFSPQLAAAYYYTGGLVPPQIEPLRWREPFLLVTLFSTRAGLLPWTPIIYLALLGLVAGARQPATRFLVVTLLTAFAIETYIVSSAWVLHAGYSYGNRRLSDGALLWGLGVAFAWQATDSRRWWRRITIGFATFCMLFNCFLTEMVRTRHTASSSAYSKSMAWVFEQELHLPPSMVRAAEWIGYPFAQPAGYVFALVHRVRPAMFESVVGMNFLERDGQWFTVILDRVDLVWGNRGFVAEGLAWPDGKGPGGKDPKAPASVTGPVRFLFAMFGKEAVELTFSGDVEPGPVAISWNGEIVPTERIASGVRAQVPVALVHAGVNDVHVDVPVGSTLRLAVFRSTSPRWW